LTPTVDAVRAATTLVMPLETFLYPPTSSAKHDTAYTARVCGMARGDGAAVGATDKGNA
jgi:hypothetical protein